MADSRQAVPSPASTPVRRFIGVAAVGGMILLALSGVGLLLSQSANQPKPRPTLTPLTGTTVPTMTKNNQWTPDIQNFDGVDMVLVPPGCFDMGSTEANDNASPINQQCFKQPFWIDKDLVTNAQFAQFNGKAANASNWTGDKRPRDSITWFEARDFCAARGLRLPTEAEWEYSYPK